MKPDKFTRIKLLILVAIGFAIGAFFYCRGMQQGTIISPDEPIRIDSLRYCGSSPSIDKIKICGVLISNKDNIPLIMYLYDPQQNSVISENPINDRFSRGEFIREIELPRYGEYGHYMLRVYFYKTIVGQIEFDIPKP